MHWTPEIEKANFELTDGSNILLQWINHDKSSLDKYKAKKDHNPEAIKVQETRLQQLYLAFQKITNSKDSILKECFKQYEEGKKMGLWLAGQKEKKQQRNGSREAIRAESIFSAQSKWPELY